MAPNQRVPRETRRPDKWQGTLDEGRAWLGRARHMCAGRSCGGERLWWRLQLTQVPVSIPGSPACVCVGCSPRCAVFADEHYREFLTSLEAEPEAPQNLDAWLEEKLASASGTSLALCMRHSASTDAPLTEQGGLWGAEAGRLEFENCAHGMLTLFHCEQRM
jgi:hypothetical protein